MKETVIELLSQRDLLHIYSESDFNYYLRKITRKNSGGNKHLIALNIFDMFILNG